MHGHDSDDVLILTDHISLCKIQIICLELINISDEVEHALAVLLEIIRLLDEHVDIRLASSSHRSGTDKPVKSGGVQHVSYYVAYGHIIFILLEIVKHAEEFPQSVHSVFFLAHMGVHIIYDLVIKSGVPVRAVLLVSAAVFTHYNRKLLLIKAHQWRP